MFSGFGLIGCSDAWILIDFDRFLMIFIDFRVSWRLGCLEARVILISIDFHRFSQVGIDFLQVFIDFKVEGLRACANAKRPGAAP